MEKVLSLSKVQWLMSQIFHDIVSGFSSVSAGMDLGPQSGLWEVIYEAKDKLSSLLCIMRVAFGHTPNAGEESIRNFLHYQNIALQGSIEPNFYQLIALLSVWIGKNYRGCEKSTLILTPQAFTFYSNRSFFHHPRSDLFLPEHEDCPRDYYILYAQLLAGSLRKELSYRYVDEKSFSIEWRDI